MLSVLTGLLLTLLAYGLATWLFSRSGHFPLLNPVLVATALIILCLWLFDIDYTRYMQGAHYLSLLLGPATVALAVPIAMHGRTIKKRLRPITLALIVSSLVAVCSSVGLAWLMGADRAILIGLSVKAATMPIALELADSLGGVIPLTAAFVFFTGILGATIGPFIFKWMNIQHDDMRGLAMGVTSHVIGTASEFKHSQEAGSYASLGMSLNGIFTAIVIPVLYYLLF
ncbi:LrgB family protein [Advenella kashmirensis]|uniref:LrgB family protein n=1 Tax=Advenella kashmirensis TaxID=310575 RepID=UPI0003F5811D|nr:LrgB family protein [Advenella kashmirensis]